jgi:hypothetical protein
MKMRLKSLFGETVFRLKRVPSVMIERPQAVAVLEESFSVRVQALIGHFVVSEWSYI